MVYAVEHSSDQTNIFNIGSDDAVDVTEIADIVAESMGLAGVKYRYTGGFNGRGWRGDVKVNAAIHRRTRWPGLDSRP